MRRRALSVQPHWYGWTTTDSARPSNARSTAAQVGTTAGECKEWSFLASAVQQPGELPAADACEARGPKAEGQVHRPSPLSREQENAKSSGPLCLLCGKPAREGVCEKNNKFASDLRLSAVRAGSGPADRERAGSDVHREAVSASRGLGRARLEALRLREITHEFGHETGLCDCEHDPRVKTRRDRAFVQAFWNLHDEGKRVMRGYCGHTFRASHADPLALLCVMCGEHVDGPHALCVPEAWCPLHLTARRLGLVA